MEMLVLISNFPNPNPLQYAMLSKWLITEMQVAWVWLTNLNQNFTVSYLDMVLLCSMTSSPGRTFTTRDSEKGKKIKPEKKKKRKKRKRNKIGKEINI